MLGHNTDSTLCQLNKMDANLNVLSTLSAVDFMLSAPTGHYGDKVSDG